MGGENSANPQFFLPLISSAQTPKQPHCSPAAALGLKRQVLELQLI